MRSVEIMIINKKGFSLVELSIVLIIIGLLITGISLGSSLITQARLGKIIQDWEGASSGVATFQLKFNALPGDMIDASEFFSDCTADSGVNVCNGNGDGEILFLWGGATHNESIRATEHLYRAGLLQGSLSNPGGSFFATEGVNSLSASIDGGVYGFGRHNVGHLPDAARLTKNNYFTLGAPYSSGGYNNGLGPLLTAAEAFNIDSKFDDGLPWSGRVLSERGNSTPNSFSVPGCANSNWPDIGYDLTNNDPFCALFFLLP
jgi:prepilin-type N-terminal cleavage/methylation domain-containing protein